MFSKILLAADGSEHSIRATAKAIEIMSAYGSKETILHVLFVIDTDQIKTDVLSNWNSLDLDTKRKKLIYPIEERLTKSGIPYEKVLLRGDPGPTIVNYANQHHFDLIIIGSRGLNPLQEFVLGSVSHKVAKRANGSVLIVK